MATELNAREQLEAAAAWLAYQEEDLSFGLKTPEDGLKLWRAWQADPELPEFCDECEGDEDRNVILARTNEILGYDPWKLGADLAEADACSPA